MRDASNVGVKSFIPSYYRFNTRQQLLGMIAERPLAQVTSVSRDEVMASATPLFHCLRDGEESFFGHLAKRNPHASVLRDKQPVLALFVGPDAYISPRWFQEHWTVPTWNYVSVQLRGELSVVTDRVDTWDILNRTIQRMENSPQFDSDTAPWSLNDAPGELVERLSEMVVAFRIRNCHLEGVQRLCQDKSPVDFRSIREGLSEQLRPGSQEIARLMAEVDTTGDKD